MQNQQLTVITPDYLVNLHTMLENLTIRVERTGTTLENITAPAPIQLPPVPGTTEVSLSFFTVATGTSKNTIKRWIAQANVFPPIPDYGYKNFEYGFSKKVRPGKPFRDLSRAKLIYLNRFELLSGAGGRD